MSDQTGGPAPAEDLRLSELIPYRSRKISFLHSKALWPIVVTVVTCLALYAIKINTYAGALSYMTALAAFILIMTFFVVYYYGGEQKNVLWYIWPAALTYYQINHLLGYYDMFFQHTLPGDVSGKIDGFVPNFIAYFFGVGLREDFMKAVPCFIALAVAFALRAGKIPSNPLTRGVALQGPLDGLLIGVASGQAFTFVETIGQYVPNTIQRVWDATNHDYGLAMLYGLRLMVPRVLDGVMGHAAYGGIVGYFAGLAVSHPRAVWKLVAIGLVTSAVCHTLWDTLGELIGPDYYTWIAGPLTVIVFFGCLLKAKQLEASRIGGPIDGHSILALSTPPSGLAPAGIVPPQPPGLAGMFTPIASMLERMVAFKATTTTPTPGQTPPTGAAIARVSIGSPMARYALAPNTPIDFSSLFAASAVPSGCRGNILAMPDGALEIVNTGASAWAATMPGGVAASVAPGERFKAMPGSRLLLGPATLSLDAY